MTTPATARPSNFYTDVICKDARFHSTQPIHDMLMLEPITRLAVLGIIADAKKLYGSFREN